MTNDFYERRDAWWAWHTLNPHVWEMFDRFAREAQTAGRTVGHWLIVNRIRWEVFVVTRGGEFKISNNHIAFYARHWLEQNPGGTPLFKIKRMHGEPWPFVSLFSDIV